MLNKHGNIREQVNENFTCPIIFSEEDRGAIPKLASSNKTIEIFKPKDIFPPKRTNLFLRMRNSIAVVLEPYLLHPWDICLRIEFMQLFHQHHFAKLDFLFQDHLFALVFEQVAKQPSYHPSFFQNSLSRDTVS